MYHCHTEDSLLDSCTKYSDYIDLAVRDGMKAISFSEHSKPLNWTEKWAACKAAGIKYMHSVEIYLTESLLPKVRDNYHTVLIARNMEGLKELNALVSKSCDPDHFYYNNRISFDEFLNISPNIISTSACLASPLNRLPDGHPRYFELAQKYDFLEIQPHNHPDQVIFNQRLVQLARQLNKPLIAGTDTHSSSKYKAECRTVLLSAKGKSYGDEDAFDLSYKTYDELVDAFKEQGAVEPKEYLQAIENTNFLYALTEEIDLDSDIVYPQGWKPLKKYSASDLQFNIPIKYPLLYGSAEADEERFKKVCSQQLAKKVDSGIIPKSQEQAFKDAIREELDVFHKIEMNGFMLSMHEILKWCRDQGMPIGPARGSVAGSRAAYVADIIDVNPEQWHTIFSRFANEHRKEVGDIDVDVIESDRPRIFKYIIERFGKDKTARVASFGTIKAKGVIDEIGRYLSYKWLAKHLGTTVTEVLHKRMFMTAPEDLRKKNPWSLNKIASIKSEFGTMDETAKSRGVKIVDLPEFKQLSDKYPELFYYFEGLLGTKVSQSVHPAGILISPVTLADNYGVFDKDGENCLMLDMENIHDYTGLVKYDLLILKTVQVVNDSCKYIGRKYPRTHEIDFDDQAVWEDLSRDTTCIFQFESKFASDSLKKFKPKSIFDMSLVTAAIRPSGASYRDELLARIPHHNPSKIIDDLLKNNVGYLVYQEDIIAFLQKICGLSGGDADNVRRAIGRKQKDRLDRAMPDILNGYCEKSDKPRQEAEAEAKEFLKIIEDASSYMFGYNHSISYCIVGYLCAYFRYYYPLEFVTAFLNDAANDEDIRNGTKYAKTRGIKITMPKWGVSRGDYAFDSERNIIAKGLSSIKYLSATVAEELYTIAHTQKLDTFTDVLLALKESSIDSRQLDTLIKLDFFSDFGNQRELMRILDAFLLLKKGDAKQIAKAKVDGTFLEDPIRNHSIGVTKSGAESKNYIFTDIYATLIDAEKLIKASGLDDLTSIVKIQNSIDILGYVGYTSDRQEDRPKLFVLDVYPLVRKKDNKQFGYSVVTKSVGSGKECRFTVVNGVFNKDPIAKGDIILCKGYERNGEYFRMTSYSHIY